MKKSASTPTTILNLPARQTPDEKKPTKSERRALVHVKNRQGQTVEGEIVALPSSTIRLFGDSTFGKYSSQATQLGIRLKFDPHPKKSEDALTAKLSEFVLIIPVAGLKSGNGLLDEHMAEALKAKSAPEIQAAMKSAKVGARNADGSYEVEAMVEMKVAGASKVEPVKAKLTIDGTHISVKGDEDLLMTDFGIQPPTLMLGSIKTDNKITIKFDFELELKMDSKGSRS